MVDVQSELVLNGIRQQKLRQTFQQAEAQSSSILFLALQWKDVDSHFVSIQKSISERLEQLVSSEDSLRNLLEEIKLREKRVESVEESVKLRCRELESREANEKLLFEKREKELELMRVSVEERLEEVDKLRQGLQALDSKERQFRLLEKSVDEKSKELEFVQNTIQQSFRELELKEEQCVKNKRGKRPLAGADGEDETERSAKQQRRDSVVCPTSTSHAETVNRHDDVPGSFWTCCTHCRTRYEYSKCHVNKKLCCVSCPKTFKAYDLGPLLLADDDEIDRLIDSYIPAIYRAESEKIAAIKGGKARLRHKTLRTTSLKLELGVILAGSNEESLSVSTSKLKVVQESLQKSQTEVATLGEDTEKWSKVVSNLESQITQLNSKVHKLESAAEALEEKARQKTAEINSLTESTVAAQKRKDVANQALAKTKKLSDFKQETDDDFAKADYRQQMSEQRNNYKKGRHKRYDLGYRDGLNASMGSESTEKSKELEFVQKSIKQRSNEFELRVKEINLRENKQCEKNKRDKRPLSDADTDGETERLTKQQRHDNVVSPPSTSHAEADIIHENMPGSFWTCCTNCRNRYEYSTCYVNKNLRCVSCLKTFKAYDLGPLLLADDDEIERLTDSYIPSICQAEAQKRAAIIGGKNETRLRDEKTTNCEFEARTTH